MITDRIGLHSVLLPLLIIIIIITQRFIRNLHTRAEGIKKAITKAAKEIVKKKNNTKMTILSLQNKLSLSLSISKNDIGNNLFSSGGEV